MLPDGSRIAAPHSVQGAVSASSALIIQKGHCSPWSDESQAGNLCDSMLVKIFCGRSCSFNTRRSWSLAPLVSSVQEAAVIQLQIPIILGLPIPPNVRVMVSWLSAHKIPDGALHLNHPNRKFKGTALLLQCNGRIRAVIPAPSACLKACVPPRSLTVPSCNGYTGACSVGRNLRPIFANNWSSL